MHEKQRYNPNVPHVQKFQQGNNARDNCLTRNVRQTRQIQPGNNFVFRVRVAIPATTSS